MQDDQQRLVRLVESATLASRNDGGVTKRHLEVVSPPACEADSSCCITSILPSIA